MPPKKKTRAQSGGIDPDINFPPLPQFSYPTKLPTVGDVIGLLCHFTHSGAGAGHSHQWATREVAKQIYMKWYHDTVYCQSLRTVERRVSDMWTEFREGRKRYKEGRTEGKPLDNLRRLVEDKNKLFDVGATTAAQAARCKEDWGVPMSDAEYRYYADQQTDRKMETDRVHLLRNAVHLLTKGWLV